MAVGGKGKKICRKLRLIRWHQWARGIAFLVLMDQALGTLSGIPSSEAIVVACIGALFAPVPVERRDSDRKTGD